jgi:hypothetical protein
MLWIYDLRGEGDAFGFLISEPIDQSLVDSAVNELALTPALSPGRGESPHDLSECNVRFGSRVR